MIVILAILITILTSCSTGTSDTTPVDSQPDTEGNLLIINKTGEALLLYESGSLIKQIPKSEEESSFIVNVANPSGLSKTLKVWKAADVNDHASPDENKLYRSWEVVLSQNTNTDEQLTWIIGTGSSAGSALGTVKFTYPAQGLDGLDNIYSVDVIINESGTKLTALSPGTQGKQVGLEYGTYSYYYQYWYDDPNDRMGGSYLGTIGTDSNFALILNDHQKEVILSVPVYYSNVGKTGQVTVKNTADESLIIYANGSLIEDLHWSGGVTQSPSALSAGKEFTYILSAGNYSLEAKTTGGAIFQSFTGLDVHVRYPYTWTLSDSLPSMTGTGISITNNLDDDMSLFDSDEYLGFTIGAGETRTVQIPASTTDLRANNRLETMEASNINKKTPWVVNKTDVVTR